MIFIRGFHVINKDGARVLTTTYNVADEEGNPVKNNAKDSFYVVDEETAELVSRLEEKLNARLVEKEQ